jgi:hypothetical protein
MIINIFFIVIKMGIKILSLFSGGFDLPDIALYTGNPIALAIGLFVVFDLVLFLTLIASDSIAKWRIFAGVSAAIALTIPIVICVYEYSKRSNSAKFCGGGGASYTKPPPEYFAERVVEEAPIQSSYSIYEADTEEITSMADLFN